MSIWQFPSKDFGKEMQVRWGHIAGIDNSMQLGSVLGQWDKFTGELELE